MTPRLKTLAAVISPRWREPSTCEACGSQFTCGATLAGCWCSEIKLSVEQRDELKDCFRSCLCGECLRAIASGSGEIEKTEVILATSDAE
jgi:hypothetical protein